MIEIEVRSDSSYEFGGTQSELRDILSHKTLLHFTTIHRLEQVLSLGILSKRFAERIGFKLKQHWPNHNMNRNDRVDLHRRGDYGQFEELFIQRRHTSKGNLRWEDQIGIVIDERLVVREEYGTFPTRRLRVPPRFIIGLVMPIWFVKVFIQYNGPRLPIYNSQGDLVWPEADVASGNCADAEGERDQKRSGPRECLNLNSQRL